MNPMAKAKAKMLLKHVFFASLVLNTKVEEDPNCPTAYTDMIKIAYNPKFIESLDDPDLVLFVLAHEVFHIMLKHGLRRGSRNPARWNIACDFAINWMLLKSGFKIWKHCLCDEKYDGMSAEQIYDQREQEREKRQSKDKSGERGPIAPGKGMPGRGTPDDGCDEESEDGLGGDVHSSENLDPETRAVIERTINQKVAQAASIARIVGKLPGEIERLVEGILNPPLPWQNLLRNYMTQVSHDDETWARRNRRHAEAYLPGRFSEKMGEIVIGVDTSGSISSQDLAQVAAELNEIVEFVKPERVRVIYCDAEIAGEQIFEEGDLIELHPRGGGGTDMRVVLKHVEQFDPVVVVLITDAYTPWPTEEPPYPLISVITTNAPCPVGEVVRMHS